MDILIVRRRLWKVHENIDSIEWHSCVQTASIWTSMFGFTQMWRSWTLIVKKRTSMRLNTPASRWTLLPAKTTEKSIRLSSSSSIFSSTKIDSNHKKRKNCEDSSTLSEKRKIASKGVKKRCNCGKYCHKTCIGKCSDV